MTRLPPPANIPPLTAVEFALLDEYVPRPELQWQLAHAIAHVRLLHPCPSSSSIIETRVFPAQKPANYYCQYPLLAQVAAAEDAIRANALGKNAFIALNPRDRFRGKKVDVPAVHWMLLDLDSEKLDVESVVSKFAYHGILPSALIVSGNGLHFYIRLWPPVVPATAAERVGRRLNIATGGDHVFDCCRVARLAGSVNHKTPPTVAYVAGMWPERTYSLEILDGKADAMGVERINLDVNAVGSGGDRSYSPLSPSPVGDEIPSDVLEILPRLPSAVANMLRTGERPQHYVKSGNSELDFRVMCALLRADLTEEMIVRIYSVTPVRRLKVERSGQSYFDRTLANAKRELAKGSGYPPIIFDRHNAAEYRDDPDPRRRSAAVVAPFPDWDESVALPRVVKD